VYQNAGHAERRTTGSINTNGGAMHGSTVPRCGVRSFVRLRSVRAVCQTTETIKTSSLQRASSACLCSAPLKARTERRN